MLNKNDPLIGAVQQIMQKSNAEREAARVVNEKFGVTDRKALPHEKQSAWDSAYKQVLSEELKGNQHKIDVASSTGEKKPDGKLTKHDFEHLRAKKKPMEEGNDPKSGDVTSPSSMGIKKPNYATGIPDYAKPKEQTVNRAAKTSLHAGTMKEAKVNPYAVGMAEVQKSTGDKPPMEKKNITKAHKIAKKIIAKKKMNEGFNNRHGLSEIASAVKQVVAEQTGMPVSGVKNSSWFSRQTDMQRATQNLSKMSRLRKLRANPTALDTKRNAELDKPGLEKAGVATALKDPKAREVLAQTTKDAANFAVPSALTGGPLGAAIGRTALGGLTQAGKLINRFRGNSSQPQPNLAAGAARRTNQSVPQVTSTPGSATGRFSASGPFGSIRDASKVTRRGGDARASGGPSGTMTSAARLQAIRRPSSGNNPPAATTAAARPATSSSQLSQAVARSKALRPQKGPADVSKSLTSNQPAPAAAKPPKPIQDRVPQEPQGVAARKIDTPTRKVTDTEIMNAPQYKQAVKSVGGEAGARKIQSGTDVSGIGKVEKGQTIWSKVKSQLEKQPVKGFEMGANKGGAGR